MTIQVQSRRREIGVQMLTKIFEQAQSVSGVPVKEVEFGFIAGGITYANLLCLYEHNEILAIDVAGIAKAWNLFDELLFFDIDPNNIARHIKFKNSD